MIRDDQGHGDFGFMANRQVRTPRLDRFAANRFRPEPPEIQFPISRSANSCHQFIKHIPPTSGTMSYPTVTPRPISTRSMCVRWLFRITSLALAGILMPHSVQAEYVGEMDGFWRRATMVDTHLKGGGGLGIIPGYVTDPGSSLPYLKRLFDTEYPHADSLIHFPRPKSDPLSPSGAARQSKFPAANQQYLPQII